jgi:epoxyqueuosine reductase QueG
MQAKRNTCPSSKVEGLDRREKLPHVLNHETGVRMMQELKGEALTEKISSYLLENGAVRVGFSTKETLQESPPGADITYLMEDGLSAISFVLPMNKEYIRRFLAKEDRLAHQRDKMATYIKARDLSDGVAEMLRGDGYNAIGTAPNSTYRMEEKEWYFSPEISHQYLAVASGAASFGWSGSVGVKGYGSAVLLGTTITDAELAPTYPIPAEDGFCSNCKACVGACPTEMFSGKEETTVTLGGREYTYAARIDLFRCLVCCGGDTGLHKSKKWSSWSPGRYEIREDRDGPRETLRRAGEVRAKRIQLAGGGPSSQFFSADTDPEMPSNPVIVTCGYCSFVCTGDREENAENLKILRESGCVIQYPDGSIKVLPSDEAEETFNQFPPEHRALYC